MTPSYTVKCDDCKRPVRETSLLQESVAGGRCERCREGGPMTRRPEHTPERIAYLLEIPLREATVMHAALLKAEGRDRG